MPQPFLGFLLQSVPLAAVARPSRASAAPQQLSTDLQDEALGTRPPLISPDSPAQARNRLSPPTALDSLFTRPKPCFPVAPCPKTPEPPQYSPLHLLRSVDPPASPFTTPTRFPCSGGRSLSWMFASSEIASRARNLNPPAPEGTNTTFTRRIRSATPGSSTPWRRVGPRERPKAPIQPARQDWPRCETSCAASRRRSFPPDLPPTQPKLRRPGLQGFAVPGS